MIGLGVAELTERAPSAAAPGWQISSNARACEATPLGKCRRDFRPETAQVFAPTGQAYLQQYLEGKRYRLAAGTHTVPQNVWFNVEIVQQGATATVRVNGKPTIQNVPVGDFAAGAFGVVSHWSKGRFDDLAIQEAP